MTDLLSRLSAAPGPSRELDAEISRHFGIQPQTKNIYNRNRYVGGKPVLSRIAEIWPRYTEFIDAAMTLVPKDLRWELWGGAKKRFRGEVWPLSPTAAVLVGFSDTNAAIALVIACLKARMEKDNASQ